MQIKKTIANQVWQIRQELGIPGSETSDWYLADLFLQTNPDQWTDNDIYVWFIQLDENMVPRNGLDNQREL